MDKIFILNTGGTFNKCYNEVTGSLDISHGNEAVNDIIDKSFRNNLSIEVEGLIYKDSLNLNLEDRKNILIKVKNNYKTVLIHGTDTMEITAKFLDDYCKDKVVVLTGAMMPYSIDTTEATSNFSLAVLFAQTCTKNGIYIAMHGLVKPYNEIKKNKKLGKFECQ